MRDDSIAEAKVYGETTSSWGPYAMCKLLHIMADTALNQ